MTFAQYVTFVNNPTVHPNATQQIILARKKERSEYLSLCLLSCQVLCSSTKVHGSLTCSLGILSLWVLGISTFLWPLQDGGRAPSHYHHHTCWISLIRPIPVYAVSSINSSQSRQKKKKPNLKNVSA